MVLPGYIIINKAVHVVPAPKPGLLSKRLKISQVLWDTVLTSSSSAITARREDGTVASSAVSPFTRVSTTQNESFSLSLDAIVELTVSHKVTVKELRKIALELINTGR